MIDIINTISTISGSRGTDILLQKTITKKEQEERPLTSLASYLIL